MSILWKIRRITTKKWKDRQFESFDNVPVSVQIEHQRQIKKWGVQERSPFEWMCYLTEEVGELAEAVSENVYRTGSASDIRQEAIQVATLALKIAEMST